MLDHVEVYLRYLVLELCYERGTATLSVVTITSQ